MSTSRTARRQAEVAWDLWVEDYDHHRRHYRQSRFRWWDEHVLGLISAQTGGVMEFTDYGQLRVLDEARRAAHADMRTCLYALAAPLEAAAAVGGWDRAADHLGIAGGTVRRITKTAGTIPIEHKASRTTARALARLGSNPLIHAWELKQAWLMWSAVHQVVDHTLTTLLWELYDSGNYTIPTLASPTTLTSSQVRYRIGSRDKLASRDPRYNPTASAPIPTQRY